MEVLIGVVAGGLVSWLISRYYYKKSRDDQVEVENNMRFQSSALSSGGATHVSVPIYSIDEVQDTILRLCPDCHSTNVYKDVPWQGDDGSRDCMYMVGCRDCGYEQQMTNHESDPELSPKDLSRIQSLRLKHRQANDAPQSQ